MSTIHKKIVIIGAGLSGLTLANELIRQGHPSEELLVVESKNRLGGLIKTTREKGYITEWGPEGLRGGKPGTEKVFSYISSKPMELPPSIPARYIVHKGKLRKVPSGPFSAIFTSLVPFFGKFRLLLELLVRKKESDETLEAFVKRRFGKGIYPVVDAVVSGIYGGSPKYLSTKYAFPFLKQAELVGGSVIRGGFKQYRVMRKNRPKDKSKRKAAFLVKPENGMADIVDCLAMNLNIDYNFHVESIVRDNEIYKIQSKNKEITADTLIIATGVPGAQKMRIPQMKQFEKVPQSLVSIVSLGFDAISFPTKYKGYGFLSPSKENTFVLGVLFTSQLFPNTAPKGKVLLRVYVGGIDHPEKATMKEDELISNVLADLEKLMNLTEKPIYSSIQKQAPHGISQIMMGHETILQWKKDAEIRNKNLYFTGIGWTSIACEALINEAVKAAQSLMS